jgi:hypothetical protein
MPDSDSRLLRVRVELLNDCGERRVIYASGETVDEAVAEAEALAYSATADQSWTMNDWAAA